LTTTSVLFLLFSLFIKEERRERERREEEGEKERDQQTCLKGFKMIGSYHWCVLIR
jgi:hypothetical protein